MKLDSASQKSSLPFVPELNPGLKVSLLIVATLATGPYAGSNLAEDLACFAGITDSVDLVSTRSLGAFTGIVAMSSAGSSLAKSAKAVGVADEKYDAAATSRSTHDSN